jgi:hypothetical protein
MDKNIVVRCGSQTLRARSDLIELFFFNESPAASSFYNLFEYPEELDNAVDLGHAHMLPASNIKADTHLRFMTLLDGMLHHGDVRSARAEIAKQFKDMRYNNE